MHEAALVNDWAAAWGAAMLRGCAQGTLCVLAAWAACRLAPRLPALRAWLWWLVCLKFAVSLLCVTPPALPILPAGHAAPLALLAPVAPTKPVSLAAPAALAHAPRNLSVPAPDNLADIPVPVSPFAFLGLAWAGGVLWMLGRAGRQWAFLRRRLPRVSEQRIVETDAVDGPLVTGLWRPTIWLPRAALSSEERALALAHETAHLRRGDLWLGLLPALTQALFFFLPPAHWAAREYRQAREEACDAEALRATGAAAADYARLLLRFAAPSPASALGLGPAYHALRRRLTTLPRAASAPWSAWARRLALLLLALALPLALPWQLTAAINRSLHAGLPDPRTLRFTLTDLGAVAGNDTDATDLNNAGQVVGCVESAPPSVFGQAFVWHDGQATPLSSLPGDRFCRANGINNAGQVIASSYSAYDHNQAFVWRQGSQIVLAGPSGFPHSKALGISDNGWVAGYGQTGDYDQKRELVAHATLWNPRGLPTDLGTLGGDYSAAYSVNNQGQVVGKADTAYFGSTHAFVWQNGRMIDLGTLGGANSVAVRVNNAGQAIGYSETATGSTHAFVWQGSALRDLGALPGRSSSEAHGLNDRGQIVGVSGGAAALWQDGQVADLNRLAPASGWKLSEATAINARGQIAGRGLAPDGHLHAFLLTPVSSKKP